MFERCAMDCASVVLYQGHYMWNLLCSVVPHLAHMAQSLKKVLLRAGQFPMWQRWMWSVATFRLGQESLDDVQTRHLCLQTSAKLPGPDFALILPHKLRNLRFLTHGGSRGCCFLLSEIDESFMSGLVLKE